MRVIFPRGLIVDPQRLPFDLDDRIRESFRAYTSGTRPEYMHHDKLGYIDTVRAAFNEITDSSEAVKDMILKSTEYSLDEYGELKKTEDFWDLDFMASCYEKGDRDSRLYGHYTGDSRLDDALMSLLARVISVVMDYGKEQPTVEQPRWIPVTERLPDTFGQFIVAVNNDFGHGYSDYADYDPYQRSWRTGLSLNGTEDVTHWMPLPKPPKEE